MSNPDQKLQEQIKMLIACAIDVADMWQNQVSETLVDSLNKSYPTYLPDFRDLILDLKTWNEMSFNPKMRYVYICSCDNELSTFLETLEAVFMEEIECQNCGRLNGWLPESEIEADEVLIQDMA